MKETPKKDINIKHCDSKYNLEKISHCFQNLLGKLRYKKRDI